MPDCLQTDSKKAPDRPGKGLFPSHGITQWFWKKGKGRSNIWLRGPDFSRSSKWTSSIGVWGGVVSAPVRDPNLSGYPACLWIWCVCFTKSLENLIKFKCSRTTKRRKMLPNKFLVDVCKVWSWKRVADSCSFNALVLMKIPVFVSTTPPDHRNDRWPGTTRTNERWLTTRQKVLDNREV